MESEDFITTIFTISAVLAGLCVWLVSPFAFTMIIVIMITGNVVMSVGVAILVEIIVILAGLRVMDVI